jgi:hypothetical protein
MSDYLTDIQAAEANAASAATNAAGVASALLDALNVLNSGDVATGVLASVTQAINAAAAAQTSSTAAGAAAGTASSSAADAAASASTAISKAADALAKAADAATSAASALQHEANAYSWSQAASTSAAQASASITDLSTKLSNPFNNNFGAALVSCYGRTLTNRFGDVINVRDYMFDGNGAQRTQTAAAQAAATVALQTGKCLYFPAGQWTLTAAITGSGYPISVKGDGVRQTKVTFTQASGGFSFVFSPQTGTAVPDQFCFHDMTIEAGGTVNQPAISAQWSTYQPTAQGMCWIGNVNITRSANGLGTFTQGIYLNRCMGALISKVILVGDDARASQSGMYFQDCLEINCTDVKVTRYQVGCTIDKTSGVTQTEGVWFTACWFYDLYCGIFSPSQAIHIQVLGCFFNPNGTAVSASIILTNASQAMIANNLIYVGGNSTDNNSQDGIRLTGRGRNTIQDNRFVGLNNVNARFGVITAGGSNYNRIKGNSYEGFLVSGGAAVYISSASDTGNMVTDEEVYNCAQGVVSASSSTLVKRIITVPLGGTPTEA